MTENGYGGDLYEAIEDLIAEGVLRREDDAFGAAQQVIANGYTSLALHQRTLYDNAVIPALKRRGEELQEMRIRRALYSN